MPQISLDDILRVLDDEAMWVIGRRSGMVSTPAPIGQAPAAGGISFCSAPPDSAASAINESGAEIVVCRAGVAKEQFDAVGKTVIGVDHPGRSFIRLVSSLFAPGPEKGIHPTAVIDPDARLGEGIHDGPLACLEARSIGDGPIIHGRVPIGDGAVVGRNVIIHPGAVIGTDGFDCERNEDGVLKKLPPIGNVLIEDDVEIGANSCIDPATLGDTVVGRGTRIDNLVHIANNAPPNYPL